MLLAVALYLTDQYESGIGLHQEVNKQISQVPVLSLNVVFCPTNTQKLVI